MKIFVQFFQYHLQMIRFTPTVALLYQVFEMGILANWRDRRTNNERESSFINVP